MFVVELEAAREEQEDEETERKKSSGKNVLLVVLLTVGKKLISNPNTHASVAGLVWALIKFRYTYKCCASLDVLFIYTLCNLAMRND